MARDYSYETGIPPSGTGGYRYIDGGLLEIFLQLLRGFVEIALHKPTFSRHSRLNTHPECVGRWIEPWQVTDYSKFLHTSFAHRVAYAFKSNWIVYKVGNYDNKAEQSECNGRDLNISNVYIC